MKFRIVAVGKIKESFFRDALAEYTKRLSAFATTEIVEVAECTFSGTPNAKEIEKIIATEGKDILAKTEGCLVALDIDGKMLSSTELSQKIENIKQSFSTITFVIGGSHGLWQEVKNRANLRLSFGKITLPHQLCRVVLAEQVYRACCIANNLPYHK